MTCTHSSSDENAAHNTLRAPRLRTPSDLLPLWPHTNGLRGVGLVVDVAIERTPPDMERLANLLYRHILVGIDIELIGERHFLGIEGLNRRSAT
jgi:hypothetical protein